MELHDLKRKLLAAPAFQFNADKGDVVASFPGLPRFRSSVCIQYNTRRQKSVKNGEGLVSLIM